MTAQTERVTQALKLVDEGMTPYKIWQTTGIALSTIYNALKRRREAETGTARSAAAKKGARTRKRKAAKS